MKKLIFIFLLFSCSEPERTPLSDETILMIYKKGYLDGSIAIQNELFHNIPWEKSWESDSAKFMLIIKGK